jgi:glycosyltransferase involved in cell wall biosynthesis
MDNVKFTGSRPPETLPSYIKAFDVAINPQRLTKATMGNYPRKIDEYLAMGKPTLATWTEAMVYFEEYTYLGKTKEDYVTLIKKALAEDSSELQEARRVYALSHSWENNVLEIGKALERATS